MKEYYKRKVAEFEARYQAALESDLVDEAVKLHAEMLNYQTMLEGVNV